MLPSAASALGLQCLSHKKHTRLIWIKLTMTEKRGQGQTVINSPSWFFQAYCIEIHLLFQEIWCQQARFGLNLAVYVQLE